MVSLVAVILSSSWHSSWARSWVDYVPLRDLNPYPRDAIERLEVSNEFIFSSAPSLVPSGSPSIFPSTLSPTTHPSDIPTMTIVPSLNPSPVPTSKPTKTPTKQPTPSPTQKPTPSPTQEPTQKPTPSPTKKPTPSPTPLATVEPFAPNPVPSNVRAGFFNYDDRLTADYGPGYPEDDTLNATHTRTKFKNNGWAKRYSIPNDFYWEEFENSGHGPWKGALDRRDPSKNRCSKVGKQSPIDIRTNGARCLEHHQIRNYPGDFSVSDAEVLKQIHPNKLRLVFPRRPCPDHKDASCAEPDPPHGDFPHNWGGFADMMHIDFKIPSEHTIYGERFDGEMQMFHLHRGRGRMPTTSVLMRASDNGHNSKLQQALDEFQKVYNDHRSQCAKRIRRERQLATKVHDLLEKRVHSPYHDYLTWGEFSTYGDEPEEWYNQSETLSRRLKRWDPYSVQLVPTVHFYAYDGSLTEPPCGEWVSWRIFDEPMKISFSQLDQMKRLIFSYVSPSCERTGAQWRGSVARPIQDTAGRDVYYCGQYEFQAECPFFPPACNN